jgi:hypothetical protein
MSIKNMESLIENSSIYHTIANGRNDIEIWNDEYIEDGWSYWNVVTRNAGVVKKLAYLRIKDNQIQKRTYDDQGDDLWVLVE